jgi:thiol-disulfide isomerase/thioredoxin
MQNAGSALVVVDFYRTSCGACKYLMPGFLKMCKATYEEEESPLVIFLKHNVFDDDESEKTDLAKRLQIAVRLALLQCAWS